MSSSLSIAGSLLACQLLFATTHAQPLPHAVGQLTTKDGLSSNTINDFLQDDEGFLWIATPDGLNRFDGTEITTWYHSADTNSLPHNFVSCLLKLPGNYLAIGTGAGLSFYNTATGIFHNFYYHLGNELDTYRNAILSLTRDVNGNTWAVTRSCIFIFDPGRKLSRVIRSDVAEARLIKERSIFVEKIWPLSTGEMLLYSTGKWRLCTSASGTLDEADHSPHLRQLSFLAGLSYPASDHAATSNPEGRLFKVFGNYFLSIGCNRDSVYLYDETGHLVSGCYFPYNRYPYVLWSQQVAPLDSSTLLFLFHDYGFATVGFHWRQGIPFPDSVSPLRFDEHKFQSALRDHQGNWWLASTRDGLQKVIPSGLPFIANTFPVKTGHHPDRHETGCFSRSGSHLWVGTYGDGFYHMDQTSGRIDRHRLSHTGADTWANFIWNIRQVSADTLWIGTQTGLFWYSISSQRCGRLPHWPGKPNALDSVSITTQFTDSRGLVWMGLGKGNGICSYAPASHRFSWYPGNSPDGYPLRYPIDIAEDSRGCLWLTNDASTSLVRFERATGRFVVVPLPSAPKDHMGPFNGLALEGDSILWLGSITSGLVRFDPARVETSAFGHDKGLDNSHIGSVYRDSAGRIWLATEGGLSCFHPNTQAFTNYTERNGLPVSSPTAWFFYDSTTGSVYNGGYGKYFSFRPGDIGRRASPPKTLITSVSVNGKPLFRESNGPIDFSPQDNDITVQYAAIDLNDGPAIRYAYRLRGIDSGWIPLGKQRQINFSHLAPGAYVFEVRAAGDNSDWNPSPTSFGFRINPPFTQTAFFYGLLALSLASVAFALHRYRLVQRRKSTQIRSEISRNLHDEVGANLTNISLSSLLAKQHIHDQAAVGNLLERIYQDSQLVSESMREIVWSINPDIDTLGEALPRMVHYASGLLEANGIELEAAIAPEVEDFRLNMRQRRDFYLIFKEAVNNMARHSNASRALIRFFRSGHTLVMTIKDNGSGFDTRFQMTHNGLNNMRERARQHRWRLEISSQPGQGTNITLDTAMT